MKSIIKSSVDSVPQMIPFLIPPTGWHISTLILWMEWLDIVFVVDFMDGKCDSDGVWF